MPTVIEVAVGLVLVFLIASWGASAINEFVEGMLRRRSRYLKAALGRLTSWDLVDELYKTKWIDSLRTPRGGLKDQRLEKNWLQKTIAWTKGVLRSFSQFRWPTDPMNPPPTEPAYIPSDILAAAVDELVNGAIEKLVWPKIDDEIAAIVEAANVDAALALLPEGVRTRLKAEIGEARLTAILAEADPEKRSEGLRVAATELASKELLDLFPPGVLESLDHGAEELERWYESAMDRLSGWYKRQTKWWLILFGLIITLLFNVDTLAVTSTLWRDETVREAAVATAEATVGGEKSECRVDLDAGEDPLKCVDAAVEQLGDLETLGLPLGWPVWPWQWDDVRETVVVVDPEGNPVPDDDGEPATMEVTFRADPRVPEDGGQALLKLLGILITAVAVSFGAPVWFDILNKFINFRASGGVPKPTSGESTTT